MKPPKFIPEVRKPWNPVFRDTWERMTPDERRWSFLFDAALILVVILTVVIAS